MKTAGSLSIPGSTGTVFGAFLQTYVHKGGNPGGPNGHGKYRVRPRRIMTLLRRTMPRKIPLYKMREI